MSHTEKRSTEMKQRQIIIVIKFTDKVTQATIHLHAAGEQFIHEVRVIQFV